MHKQFNIIVSLLLTLIVGSSVSAQDITAQATEEASTASQVVYYLADGDNGVDQVFRQVLDGQNNRQQLTTSDSDIVAFGVAGDGLLVAYIANGRLQLHQVDAGNNSAVEVLTVIDGGQSQASLAFSPDSQYVAYADEGVWLMDLNTRESTLILEDIPFDEVTLNTNEVRLYRPDRFVIDPQTGTLKLLIDIGMWESRSAGVYDIDTDTFQEIEPYNHSELLPLSDGRVLIYGNNFIGGDEQLKFSASLDDVTNPEVLLDLTELPDYLEKYGALSVYTAIEIQAGMLRVFVYPLLVSPPPANGIYVYYFDFEIESGVASEVKQVKLGEREYVSNSYAGVVSPDGMSIAIYGSYAVSGTGTEAGIMQIYDLTSGEPTDDVFPDRVGEFKWDQQS